MLDQKLLFQYNKTRKTKNESIFCHAPFTSMNFEQNGHVTVCCYNRKYILGTYPDEGLKDMWYGGRADKLRGYMKKNVLPAGCDICYYQFGSKNFGGLRAQFYDVLAEEAYPEEGGRFIPMPKVMEFEISNVCNLECTMCYGYFSSSIRKNREHLPPLKSPYNGAFVEQLKAFIPHLTEARFLGGEPFLIKTHYHIWDLIIQLNPNIKVSITTNGTILNDRVKDVLEKLNAHMIISIDSLDPKNYERIRVGARFDQVMENIKYFRDYVKRKNMNMMFAVCPMQGNWRELPHFLEYCNAQGIRLFFNTVIKPREASLRNLRGEELGEVVEYLNEANLTEDTEVQKDNKANYLDLIQQIMDYRNRDEYDHFKKEDISKKKWKLTVEKDSLASLVLPPDNPESVRIDIKRAKTKTPWHIQLNKSQLSIKSNHRYAVLFRARADSPRGITLVIAKAHEPWDCLGLYKDVGLTSEWQIFQEEFIPTAGDEDARLYFDMGHNDVSVELSDIRLSSLPIRETLG